MCYEIHKTLLSIVPQNPQIEELSSVLLELRVYKLNSLIKETIFNKIIQAFNLHFCYEPFAVNQTGASYHSAKGVFVLAVSPGTMTGKTGHTCLNCSSQNLTPELLHQFLHAPLLLDPVFNHTTEAVI